MSLTAEGLSHGYRRGEPGEIRALNGIDLTIEADEFVLVAGANGSGKTTLLQCLSGLMRPTTGRVTIDGTDAVKVQGAAAMSIQFPERALFAPSVYDDIAFGPTNMGMGKEEARERALEAARTVGLGEELLSCHPRALSHGQRRLAALAGVVAVEPRYLLLDEPTAGLDAQGKARIVRTLGDLNKAGMAVVVASHDLENLMGACRRLLVLEGGRIALDGKPEDLVSCENIESLGLALPPSLVAARWLRCRGIDAPWNTSPEDLAGHLRRLRDGTSGMV